MITQLGNNVIVVQVQPNVALKFTRSHGENIGYYLGAVVIDSDGIANTSTGIIGKMDTHIQLEGSVNMIHILINVILNKLLLL